MPNNLTGLVTGDDLKPIAAQRSKSVDEKTITATSANALELKLSAEMEDCWRIQYFALAGPVWVRMGN
jgi:hypothetical protein